MNRDKALKLLRELAEYDDAENAHVAADGVLLALINDPEITQAFEDVPRWYS